MRPPDRFAYALAFLLAACPGDDGNDDAASPGTSGQGTTTEADADTSGDTTDGLPALPGVCAATCTAPEDCGDPADFECNEGFCDFVGVIPPCVPAECPNGACAPVNGIISCTFPCTPGGDQCDFSQLLECTGMDDAGQMICAAPLCFGNAEGMPCEIPAQGGDFGVCTDGECVCLTNDQCTIDGQACNN